MITPADIRRSYKNPCLGCDRAKTERPAYRCKDKCGKWKGYDFCVWRDCQKLKKYYHGELANIEHIKRVRRLWEKKVK